MFKGFSLFFQFNPSEQCTEGGYLIDVKAEAQEDQ